MKVKIGDTLECEYCTGILVACTKKWAIIRESNGAEYAVYYFEGESWLTIPAEIEEEDSEEKEIDIQGI